MKDNFRSTLLLLFLSIAVVGITSTALMNSGSAIHENPTTEPQEKN